MMRSALFTKTTTKSTTTTSRFLPIATGMLHSAQRDIFVFTQQSEALQNNARHLNYKSNVWVEEADKYWWSKITELKSPQERPTEVITNRLIEYYNLACLADPTKLEGYSDFMRTHSEHSDNNSNTNVHYSWRSKLPFKGRLNKEFEEASIAHGYNMSRFWITATEVQKQKLRLNRGSRRTGILINSPTVVFNADQFKNPDLISKQPISGYKRRQYGGNFHSVLSADIAKNNYSTGLYFTLSQLELYGLVPELKPDCRPVEVPLTDLRGSNVLFNIEQVENNAALADALNRYPVQDETYMISGRPVANEATLKLMKKARSDRQFKSGYWVSEKDVVARGYKLKQGVTQKDGVEFQFTPKKTPVAVGGGDDAAESKNDDAAAASGSGGNESFQRSVLLYNADQLQKRDHGFKLAGSKATL